MVLSVRIYKSNANSNVRTNEHTFMCFPVEVKHQAYATMT